MVWPEPSVPPNGYVQLLAPPEHASRGNTTGWITSQIPFNAKTGAQDIAKLPDYCYAFLTRGDYKDGDRESLLAHFGVPKFVANRTCFLLNGFFGLKATYDEKSGHITSCTTWFRCLFKMIRKVPPQEHPSDPDPEYVYSENKDYQWYEMTVFTRWGASGKCQVLCVDVPFDFPAELQKVLQKRTAPPDFSDPFAMHLDLWDQIIVYYDISVWRVRDPVRLLEKSQAGSTRMFEPSHEHTRHAIHVTEVLESAVRTATDIQQRRAEIYDCLNKRPGRAYEQQAKEYAAFQISAIKNLKLRSESNESRLSHEINYAFNNLAMRNNNFIKSITLLTMVFLPATFTSAIFSTTFFSYGKEKWEVSDQLWIYWAIILPATAGVLSLWGVSVSWGDKILDFLKNLAQPFKGFITGRAEQLPRFGGRRGVSKDAETGPQ